MEFSSNAFLDVYQGHIDTLNHIWVKQNSAFHLMMSDIFNRAQWVFWWVWLLSLLIDCYRLTGKEVNIPGPSIANINLDEIEAWWACAGSQQPFKSTGHIVHCCVALICSICWTFISQHSDYLLYTHLWCRIVSCFIVFSLIVLLIIYILLWDLVLATVYHRTMALLSLRYSSGRQVTWNISCFKTNYCVNVNYHVIIKNYHLVITRSNVIIRGNLSIIYQG